MKKTGLIVAILACCEGAMAQLPDGLYAAFDTTMGGFTCRLDYAEAPVTCANFAGLAEGSQHWIDPTTGSVRNDPFYDGLIFHRVIDDFMIQGGCPLGNGTSDPGYKFPDEFNTNLTHQSAGILSMANSGPDSNGSQFFITLGATPHLDEVHSVFGEVVDGMNIVSNIGTVATDAGDRPLTNVVMNSVQILRVGAAAEAFDPPILPVPKVLPHSLSITSGVPAKVLAGTITNQCEVRLFNSTNLTDWVDFNAKYFPVATESWEQSTSINRSSEYFKATQIYYPQAVTAFSDIEGHTLTFTNETDTLEFTPSSGGTGTCNIAGNPDTLIFWAEWTSAPYFGRVTFDPESYVQFQFTLSPDGTCNGYWWNGAWNSLGEFSFTDTPPAP